MSITDAIFIIVTSIQLEILIGYILARGIFIRKEEILHTMIVNEIHNIINDKEIFDEIKSYITDLGQGALSRIMPKSQPLKVQDIIGLALQHFFMPKTEKPPEQQQQKPLRNPFQKT
ncbi:MAG: hypothetical protein QW292_14535 [Candidatus Parvarchaeota archaeon]